MANKIDTWLIRQVTHWIVLSIALATGAVRATDTAAAAEQSCEIGAASQLMLNTCAADEQAAADEELNRVYREVLAHYADDPLFRERLKTAQRARIAFRKVAGP